ncbi:DUF4383 domain-containing protein [Mycobacterium sp. NPDC006124]|uniref:DUF4383 domain-containing protein n=1 Tax=Mycobacterium sp. NPDC006124 TaxID=3156729 RepID=UPI0033AEE632
MFTSHPTDTSQSRPKYVALQWIALALGVIFLIVGVLSFIPGVTHHYDELTLTGHHSEAALLGVLDVSVVRNVVHLLFGVGGIALARKSSGARKYLLGGGLVYLVVFFYGLVIDHDSTAAVLPDNDTDNWLHLATAVLMVVLGAVPGLNRRAVDHHAEPNTGP